MMQTARTRKSISVSDTATWVAMYRAIESERPDALFHDPYARSLAGEKGEELLRRMPQARQYAGPMIVRTAAMDELIEELIERHGIDLVVNLAAGLDTRPYRMQLPRDLQWVEADYPPMIDEKSKALAGETPHCKLERIGVDLADRTARRALFERVGAMGANGLVISEGLLVYLSSDQVTELAQDLAAQSIFRFWITDIASPLVLKMMKRTWSRQFAADSASFQFAPKEGAAFFAPYGWRLERYHSTFLDMFRHHREPSMAWLWRLFFPRWARQEVNRREGPMTGTLLLSRLGRSTPTK
jgi:methyltransferase (TIGR00027 family)